MLLLLFLGGVRTQIACKEHISIPEDYDLNLMPPDRNGQTQDSVDVTANLKVMRVQKVDDHKTMFTVLAGIVLEWNDPRYRNGVDSIKKYRNFVSLYID